VTRKTAAGSLPSPKDFVATLTFDPTTVNDTAGYCFDFCFCLQATGCKACDSSGTYFLDHFPSAPFLIDGFRLLTNSSRSDCDDGAAIQSPFTLSPGQRVAFTVTFAPTEVGSFNDSLRMKIDQLFTPGYATLALVGTSAQPNLVPSPLPGWSGPLVVSTTAGARSDSDKLRSDGKLYASWAVKNDSPVKTIVPFQVGLKLDGVSVGDWTKGPPLAAMDFFSMADLPLGPLDAGPHTLELIPDEAATTGPSRPYPPKQLIVEGIVPAGVPVVSTAPGSPSDSPVISIGQPLYLSFTVQNKGGHPTDATFYNEVRLDGGELERSFVLPPLSAGDSFSFPDFRFGPLAAGSHTLELVTDATQAIGAAKSVVKTFTVVAPPPPPAPPVPTTSTSWYIRATRPYQQDSALYSWAFQAGQKAGQLNASARNANFVILDFGAPWKLASGTYGASGFGRPLTVSEIASVVKQFVLGYEKVTPLGLFLAAGTSSDGPYVTPAHAQAWAKMLGGLADWVKSEGFNVQLAAASDAEPGFTSSPVVAQKWFRALHDAIASSGKSLLIYDYGDAEACPTTAATSTPLACGTTGWTQKDIADLTALYIPEIFNNRAALQWQQISLYTDLRSSQTGTLIRGPLSQSKACTLPGTSCTGANNTPAQAWRQLVRALNGSPTTAPGVPELLWSTDLNWNTNKNP
jgi:hypothetical protein